MPRELPDIGRWISIRLGDRDFKYKVLDYEDSPSHGWSAETGFRHSIENVCVVKTIGGDNETLREGGLLDGWKYCDPSKEEIEIAQKERKNNILGYKCNLCGTNRENLLKCSACKQVRYCNIECQKTDWDDHRKNCRKVKFVTKLSPRYPMKNVDQIIAKRQAIKQEKLNRILKNALTGKFKVNINGEWKTNPVSTEMDSLDRLSLCTLANKDYLYHFKQRFLEDSDHGSSPASCSLFMMMEHIFEEDGFKNGGGLHYLVDFAETDEPGLFWGMALNFNTFGTVAPFDVSCYCNFPKMPPAYRKMKKQWDKIFSRAKADIKDVQCMFTDTKEGCHSYGLPGNLGCKFKHDIRSEKEEETEVEKANDEDKSSVPPAWQKNKSNGRQVVLLQSQAQKN